MGQKNATIKIEKKGENVSIIFSGYLEYGILEEVKKELQLQLIESDNGYIIDMRNVSNIDSTGFGMIVNFARKVSVTGNKIVIIIEDDFIRSLFSISQCDKVFPIVKNDGEAIKVLKENWVGELTIEEY